MRAVALSKDIIAKTVLFNHKRELTPSFRLTQALHASGGLWRRGLNELAEAAELDVETVRILIEENENITVYRNGKDSLIVLDTQDS